MQTIALFGGSFDPVHNGHLQTSIAIQDHFQFDTYYFLPCNQSPLKSSANANNQQRVEMLQIALSELKNTAFQIDLREINRAAPSYMIDTLESFRKEHPSAAITLILGYDTFLALPEWHQWEKIINLANLLVINRNDHSKNALPSVLEHLINKHNIAGKADTTLLNQPAAGLLFFNAGNYDISSTAIRDALKLDKLRSHTLPKSVAEYIKQQKLYC